MFSRTCLAVAISALLVACSQSNPPVATPTVPAAPLSQTPPKAPDATSTSLDLSPVKLQAATSPLPADWAKGAVFIEIYVRGYKDSNGDGIGDFKGLTSQLDYLKALGVQGIWLMPINQSQDHDHGYAVTDYRKLEPDYGSEADFREFLKQAHARGIGVIMDYVINHSAYKNPLFLDSKNRLNGKRDWYIWADHNPDWYNWDHSETWHRAKPSHDYYYGVFWEQMPDFNLRNPAVVAYHHDNLRYWMNLGVDGFRFDAVNQLIENGKDAYQSQPENKIVMQGIQQVVTQQAPQHFIVCEEPTKPVEAAQPDYCGSAFAFGFNDAVRETVSEGRVSGRLMRILQTYPLERMGLLLGNHDSYAGKRLIDAFAGDEAKYRLAAATLLTMPGQPFIYYGEEIGMGTSQGNQGDWGLRAPMSWTSDGGFSSHPQIFRAAANNLAQYNAKDEMAKPDSLWHFYQTLIQLRKTHPALRYGDLQILAHQHALAFIRHVEKETVLVVLNYDATPAELTLEMGKPDSQWQPLLGEPTVQRADPQGRLTLHAAGMSVSLYQLK